MGNKMCTCAAEEIASPDKADLNLQNAPLILAKLDASAMQSGARNQTTSPRDEATTTAKEKLANIYKGISGSRESPGRQCGQMQAVGDLFIESPRLNTASDNEEEKVSPLLHKESIEQSRMKRTSYSPAPSYRSRYANNMTQAFKLPSFFSAHSASSNANDGYLILEGTLLKYKPGVTEHYLERWCRLTKNAFAYYAVRPKQGRKNIQTKPIINVSLNYVESVRRVEANIQHGGNKPGLYQFEIFLKPAADLSQIFKSSVASIEQVKGRQIFKSPKLRGGRLDESKTTQSRSIYIGGQERGSIGDAQPSKKLPTVEVVSKILGNAPLSQSIKRSRSKGWNPECRSEELLLVLDGAHFENMDEKEDYRSFKKTHRAELGQILIKEEVPRAKDLSGWTEREMEWSKAEKRLLLGCQNEDVCNHWVSVMNWILSKFYSH